MDSETGFIVHLGALVLQLGSSDMEELRKRNIADNQLILQQLMKDLDSIRPRKIQAPKKKPRTNRRVSDITETRRNPARTARYNPLNVSPPMTRARRGSVSSSISTSSGSSAVTSPDRLLVRFGFFGKGSTTDPLNTDQDFDEDYDEPRRKRLVTIRDERSAEEITDDDLNMVAEFVSEKKYDSIYGSSCHQCRQKTNDMKTICRSGVCFGIRGQFCGPCLRNRYGENVKEALKNPNWECPPCRRICNCSFCRTKQGKASTGILIHLARERGFSNVNEYLQSLQKKS